jgi:hypothetical protein
VSDNRDQDGWMNIYSTTGDGWINFGDAQGPFPARESADACSHAGRLACIEIPDIKGAG